MGVDKEVKVATVDVESGDNMATLPASSRSHHSVESAEKNAAAIKEMEIKNVMPKPLERLSIIYNLYYVFVRYSVCHESLRALRIFIFLSLIRRWIFNERLGEGKSLFSVKLPVKSINLHSGWKIVWLSWIVKGVGKGEPSKLQKGLSVTRVKSIHHHHKKCITKHWYIFHALLPLTTRFMFIFCTVTHASLTPTHPTPDVGFFSFAMTF